MGCGKSSVGRELSELLCCPFMDLDDAIVESAGRSIPEIFATEGEPAFRQMELEALKEMVPKYSRGPLPLRGPLPWPGVAKCLFHTIGTHPKHRSENANSAHLSHHLKMKNIIVRSLMTHVHLKP